MSRHRKIRLSRSKAIVIAAAGALSVATGASATAATWSQGTQGHAAGSDGPTEIAHEQRLAARKRAAELAASHAVPAASGSPRQIAQAMLGSFGWSSSQFSCLDPLWEHESRWSVTAANPGSGAFGIPQALPGSRMASAGPDWQTSAATQITWGMQYIRGTYGSPCAAWSHERAASWY